jgi:uncharacterized integral membrane protein
MSRTYSVVSGVIFGLVALLQAARAVADLPVRVGTYDVPVIASWIAAVVAGGLCVWAFSSRPKG